MTTTSSKWQLANNALSVSTIEHQIAPQKQKTSALDYVDFVHVSLTDDVPSVTLDSRIHTNCVIAISDSCEIGKTGKGLVLPRAVDCIGKTIEIRWVGQETTGNQDFVFSLVDSAAPAPIEKSKIQGYYLVRSGTAAPVATVVAASSASITVTGTTPRPPSFLRFLSIGTVWLLTDGILVVT